jgi:hypothetical protein
VVAVGVAVGVAVVVAVVVAVGVAVGVAVVVAVVVAVGVAVAVGVGVAVGVAVGVMTVKDIILAHLRKVGADGLCCDGCGCSIDDLAPCCEYAADVMTCEPARKAVATESGECWEIGDEIFVPMAQEDKK